MSTLTTITSKPLMPQRQGEAKDALVKLISAYPEPYMAHNAEHADQMKKARVAAYMLAFEGLPGWSIDSSVKDFIQGRIDRKARHIMPTAEEIAARARELVLIEAGKQSAARALAEQQADLKAAELRAAWAESPEGKAEMLRRKEASSRLMAKFKGAANAM